MEINKEELLVIGDLKKGKNNLISDVAGVKVGHKTLNDGEIQTGVTAIIPHEGNIFKEKLLASCYVINGFAKPIGCVQIEELGCIETPIILTNTLSMGTAASALIERMVLENTEIGNTTGTVNPLVFECNDMRLNDISGFHVSKADVWEAIDRASPIFDQGAVGAGRGMRCHELKGGIGTSSRVFEIEGKKYTLGSLVLSNHGKYEDLTVGGKRLSNYLKLEDLEEPDQGSIIIILATDLPLNERQLKRLCKRATVGLSRTGSYIGNGSGEVVLAFSTANRIYHYGDTEFSVKRLKDESLDIIFKAVGESVEESVINSLLQAEKVVGKNGFSPFTLSEILEKINSSHK